MVKRVKVGFIGAGYIAGVQMRQLQRLHRHVELSCVTDVLKTRAEALAHDLGLPHVSPDWHAIVEDPEIRVVHVCTPNHLHYPITKAALMAGKHVFSEKPLALTPLQGAELALLAKEHRLEAGVNFCYRYYPVLQEAAVRCRQKDLGDLLMVNGEYLQDHLLSSEDYNWRLNPEESGESSVIADLGCHWFDLVEFVTGQKIAEIFCDTYTHFSKRGVKGEERVCDLEDVGTLLLRFENGARGTFVCSQMAAGRKCRIDLQIYGSEEAFCWNHERPAELWIGHRSRPNEVMNECPKLQQDASSPYALLPAGHPMGYHDVMFNLFRDFYGAVIANENEGHYGGNYPDFEDGVRQLQLVQAAVHSAQSGQWVELPQSQLAGV